MRSESDRFWTKVSKTDTCWNWVAFRSHRGYGQFRLSGQKVPAHRYAYELLVGPIPEGMDIDHLCRNPRCVNPAHLEPVTHRENCRRGEAGAHNAAKTHCPSGHAYDEANTYVYPDGRRHCRACNRDKTREYRLSK